jgi:hypothetical protein
MAVARLIFSAPALALVIAGGGKGSTDCLGVFQVSDTVPLKGSNHINCIDGDATCDADGVVNGVCQIPVAVCANSTAASSCTLDGVESMVVDHSADNGDPKFDPEFQALQTRLDTQIQPPAAATDECTNPTNFHVTISGPFKSGTKNTCKSSTKTVKLTTVSTVINGKISTDTDTLKLTCLPAAGGCDPQILFDGTFDRIQKQVFNQTCALSHCHDSQTRSGDLLLETGAADTNLINVEPSTSAALGAGWKRVTVLTPDVSGDSSTSFLYHKVKGDLPDASYGVRMPKGKPKLKSTLTSVIQLWIDAGAPQTGWVPGTD